MKKLINEINKQSLNYNMRFDEFDITQLIINTNKKIFEYSTIFLNKANPFYNAVLNKYWSTLRSRNDTFTEGGKEVTLFSLKSFRDYTDPERRQSFI